jgi:hypothetical protein
MEEIVKQFLSTAKEDGEHSENDGEPGDGMYRWMPRGRAFYERTKGGTGGRDEQTQ